MVQKRKSKVRKVRAAKKKATAVKRLKLKSRAHESSKRPQSAKKHLRAKLPATARKPVAKAVPVKAAGAQAADKAGKKSKTPIKSAKQALELLEAKVNEVKAKGKGGRVGGRRRKEEWLIPAEMPKEDSETRRTRLKNLIKLGKERGFLNYSEINNFLLVDVLHTRI